jgi:hypothetical protein
MKRSTRWFSLLAAFLFLIITVVNLFAQPPIRSFTGEVSDAMCGRKHMESEGTPAQCTRACVSHGSKYALIVGDKVYVLDTEDKAALATLDQQAGKNATVKGLLNPDDTITVKSVAAK